VPAVPRLHLAAAYPLAEANASEAATRPALLAVRRQSSVPPDAPKNRSAAGLKVQAQLGLWTLARSFEDPLVPSPQWGRARARAQAVLDAGGADGSDSEVALPASLPPGLEAEAWAAVIYARKFGPRHSASAGSGQSLFGRFAGFLQSGDAFDWGFLAMTLSLLGFMDVTILQQLPETLRTHVLLLTFWLLVAVAYGVEVWCRVGPEGGLAWMTGYFMELVFSVDNIFVVYLLFTSLETPRRLTQKALFVALLGSLAARPLLLCGLAPLLVTLRLVPYALGLWFIYCGTRQLVARGDDGDVTQTTVVTVLRRLLGRRLCEFYDEESEAVFVRAKSQMGMSLLGVTMLCLFAANTVTSVDVAMAKAEAVPNGCISFSSSAIALFAARALFFVARDVFMRCSLSQYGVGLVLLFVGAEALVAQTVYVSALASAAVVASIMVLMAAASCISDSLKTVF